MAVAHRYINLDTTLQIASTILNTSKSQGYQKGQVLATKLIGDFYSDNGVNKKAIEKYEASLAIAKELNDQI